MTFFILSLFPQIFSFFFSQRIIKKATEKNLIKINLIDLRNFSYDKRGSVDDRVYGGGKGMILRVDVINRALMTLNLNQEKKTRRVILTTPQGSIYSQEKALEYSKLKQLVIICGHYEGVDERVKKFVDEEISLGDFIMTGGEVVALAVLDSVTRLIPGVLEKEAVDKESFSEYEVDYLIKVIGENDFLKKLKDRSIKKIKLLEHPQYTRPRVYKNLKVPKVLLSGNHREIERWRLKKSLEITLIKRPDLVKFS
ncbi:MAG: tRNA (guanosine(37)-N1)-methyltransferase TrmD [Patescibacteria group bacterium]|nr:tRNA (guanosine(37)-N1)-methyltransferase TrmD [Patescibacteria group bacterium]